MNNFNVECKFQDKQNVKVASGFHKGKLGKVIRVFSKGLMPKGLHTSKDYPGLEDQFAYEIETKKAWILDLGRESIYAFEGQLEEVENSVHFIRD